MNAQLYQENFMIGVVQSKFKDKDSPAFTQASTCEASTRLM
jgi:hypothetical protein